MTSNFCDCYGIRYDSARENNPRAKSLDRSSMEHDMAEFLSQIEEDEELNDTPFSMFVRKCSTCYSGFPQHFSRFCK